MSEARGKWGRRWDTHRKGTITAKPVRLPMGRAHKTGFPESQWLPRGHLYSKVKELEYEASREMVSPQIRGWKTVLTYRVTLHPKIRPAPSQRIMTIDRLCQRLLEALKLEVGVGL